MSRCPVTLTWSFRKFRTLNSFRGMLLHWKLIFWKPVMNNTGCPQNWWTGDTRCSSLTWRRLSSTPCPTRWPSTPQLQVNLSNTCSIPFYSPPPPHLLFLSTLFSAFSFLHVSFYIFFYFPFFSFPLPGNVLFHLFHQLCICPLVRIQISFILSQPYFFVQPSLYFRRFNFYLSLAFLLPSPF